MPGGPDLPRQGRPDAGAIRRTDSRLAAGRTILLTTMPSPACNNAIVCFSALLMATGAVAQDAGLDQTQSVSTPETDPQFLRPLDASIEDVSPIATSLRIDTRLSLQQPTGFSEVYAGPGGDDLMRINGALYAVFPRSQYVFNEDQGLTPVIPQGTVFRIGTPDPTGVLPTSTAATPEPNPLRAGARLETAAPTLRSGELAGQRLDLKIAAVDGDGTPVVSTPPTSADTTHGGRADERPHPDHLELTTILDSPEYRATRFASLLTSAATAEATDASADQTPATQ